MPRVPVNNKTQKKKEQKRRRERWTGGSIRGHPTVAMWLPHLAWVAVGWSHPSTIFSIYLFIIIIFFCVLCFLYFFIYEHTWQDNMTFNTHYMISLVLC
jgi:hypothetical protein